MGPDEGDGRVGDGAEPLALVGGRLVRDGRLEPAVVVVADGRIDAVEAGGPPPEGVRVVDLGGATLLPGFIDAHVHLQFAEPAQILRGGVTTVRDLGSPRAVREAAAATRLGVVLAGRILTPPGGYPTRSWGGQGESREVADAADARHAVDEQLEEGATVVKVALEESGGPLFAADVLRAIVDAAHEADVGVTAHVGSAAALRLAVEAGVDELAHLPLHPVTPSEMEAAAAAGMVLCPTLAIRGDDPEAATALAAFRAAGGTVVYGTDLGNGGTAPGIMVAELRAMQAAGMSGADLLDAATAVPASYLGLPDRGRVDPGAAADLIAVDGDPLTTLGAYEALRLVVAAGAVVHHELEQR